MPYQYKGGEPALLGDRVRFRRWFRRTLTGTVDHVWDPSRPSPPWGDNDMGIGVRWDPPATGGGWFGSAAVKDLELLGRAPATASHPGT